MAEKRQDSGFTVTDRRLFTEDGELRSDAREEAQKETARIEKEREAEKPKPPTSSAVKDAPSTPVTPFPSDGEANLHTDAPPPPTVAEQQEQADAYRKSSEALNSRVELSGRSAKESPSRPQDGIRPSAGPGDHKRRGSGFPDAPSACGPGSARRRRLKSQ